MSTYTVWHKDRMTGEVSEVQVLATSSEDAIRKAVELAKKFGHELSPFELDAEEN